MNFRFIDRKTDDAFTRPFVKRLRPATLIETDVRAARAHAALAFDGAGYRLTKDLAIPENITLVSLPPFLKRGF
jgi:hypothetical protein